VIAKRTRHISRAAARWRDRVVALELAPGDLSIHHCEVARIVLGRSR